MKINFDKLKSFTEGFKDLTSVTVATLIGNAILALFWFLAASIMGPEKFGEVSYYIAIAQITSIVALIGSGNTLIVNISKEVKIQASIFFITIIVVLALSTLLFFLTRKIELSLFVVGVMIFALVTSDLLGKKLYKKYSIVFVLQRSLVFVLGIPLYYIIGQDGLILGYALSFYPLGILLYGSLKKTRINFSLLKACFGFMMHSYAFDLSRMLPYYADKVIIAPIFGFLSLGNYQLGIQLLLLLSIIPLMVYQYVLPLDSRSTSTKKIKIFAVLFTIILTSLAIVLIPVLIPILYPEFVGTITIMQITVVSAIPISINLMYTSKFLGAKKGRLVLVGATISIALQILLILGLSEIYGIVAAALAIVISQATQSIYFILIYNLKKNIT